jgi:hypothetical protein
VKLMWSSLKKLFFHQIITYRSLHAASSQHRVITQDSHPILKISISFEVSIVRRGIWSHLIISGLSKFQRLNKANKNPAKLLSCSTN